ncbi:MAG TPA: DUF2510 domain-containing protein [Protaetiibacter sp.]|nr:DUF2510 domain-containing protein [Protaetiibacter sp.]
MTDQATRVVPAGWYEDPSDAEQVRWWNGINWTDHTQPKPDLTAAETRDAADDDAGAAAVRTRVRIRTTSTAESWLVAFSSAGLAVALLAAGWAWLYLAPTPMWVLIAVVGVYALSVLFAVLDRRKLSRWDHTPPPFWSTLVTAPVYLLVRALRLPHSWGQLATCVLLAVGLIGLPVAAWFGGALGSVETAVRIQSEIRATLVDSGQAASVACPPIADTTTVGSIYSCNVTLPDGTEKALWVSIDSVEGDYSYAFAIK